MNMTLLTGILKADLVMENLHHAGLHSDLLWNMTLAFLELLTAYFAGILCRKLILRMTGKAKNKGVWTFFASFINIALKIAGVIIALDQLGVSMNLIIGALSALGVGISLALKDNMASVASGLQLLLTKPFKVGDYIRMGKHEGQVRSIEITYTTLMTRNNEMVIIPNNSLIIKSVENMSNEPDRRVVITYPSKKEDISRNEKELLIAAKSSSLVLSDPAPSVRIVSYQIDGATLELLAFTKPYNYWNCSSEIMANIHQLQESGLIDQDGAVSEITADQSGSVSLSTEAQTSASSQTSVGSQTSDGSQSSLKQNDSQKQEASAPASQRSDAKQTAGAQSDPGQKTTAAKTSSYAKETAESEAASSEAADSAHKSS